ncbi:helicase-associated domain-containing protein [Bacillus sp. FJAT-28004]|uniref:helicase-associated domain-containing protein n=1 Tax=Bacillus sp. FJAT-28004 TaxID=1679165 RepID=UPI0006B4C90B|nr:helicase-associated domain-containing protein [Bacillus sp. FJAT-28004]
MKMKQLLGKLSTERLDYMMQGPLWQKAGQRGLTWTEAAVDDETIKEVAAMLSRDAVVVLREMLRHFAAAPVDGERLLRGLRKNTSLSGAECQLGLSDLEEAGVLFTVQKVWGESLYFLPVESFAGWQRVLFPYKAEPLPAYVREILMGGVMRTYCRPLGRQLLCAFSILGSSGLVLTANGTLPKKTITKLLQATDLEECWLKSFDMKWSHSDIYPVQIAFVLEAGSAFGLITAVDGALKWNEAKLREWLNLDEAEREHQLMNWCLTLLLPSAGGSAHLAASLTIQQTGEWYSNQSVEAWLQENRLFTDDGMDHNPNRTFSVHSWYGLWHNLGWMELVDCKQSDGTALFFRWRSAAPLSAERRERVLETLAVVAVQPNGELIAQPECPFWMRWELELIAERKSDEQVSVYRLEAASISRALEQGRSRTSIQSFLEQASGGDRLPTTVEALLEVWTSRACRVEFAEVALLRCDSVEMADIVENDRSIAPLLIQKLGQLDYIVDKSKISEIRVLLQKAGYPARKMVQTSTDDDAHCYPYISNESDQSSSLEQQPEKESKTQVPSFIYESFSLHHYELSDFEARKKLLSFSEVELVPTMWTKQLRAYHHSTRKELIEKALQWQTPVQLCMEKELRSFVPEKLEQQGDGWAVVGLLRDDPQRELIRLTPDMWAEMRLVIPGQGSPI